MVDGLNGSGSERVGSAVELLDEYVRLVQAYQNVLFELLVAMPGQKNLDMLAREKARLARRRDYLRSRVEHIVLPWERDWEESPYADKEIQLSEVPGQLAQDQGGDTGAGR